MKSRAGAGGRVRAAGGAAALAVALASPAAQALRVEPVEGGAFRVTQDASVALVAVRIGEATRARLEPGEAVVVPGPEAPVVAGRFDVADWAAALADVSEGHADAHLRTAGYYLDALQPGAPGVPAEAANVRALARVAPEITATWPGSPPLRDALAARAARHVTPGPLLDALLTRHPPGAPDEGWPQAYEVLAPLGALLSEAIEAHGPAALPVLIDHPAWLAERGFDDGTLVFALDEVAPELEARLKARAPAATGSGAAPGYLPRREQPDTGASARAAYLLAAAGRRDPALPDHPGLPTALLHALAHGDHASAASLAVRLALRPDPADRVALGDGAASDAAAETGDPAPELVEAGPDDADGPATVTRLVCAGLDLGAQRAITAGQHLAADAYLRLAARRCGPSPALLIRAADLSRARGAAAQARADLDLAAGWCAVAVYFGDRPADRARLADTLADLAMLQYGEGDHPRGDAYLERARAADAFRPKVLDAMEARPRVDPRARVGIMIIVLFLLVFSVRRLRRVWARPRQ